MVQGTDQPFIAMRIKNTNDDAKQIPCIHPSRAAEASENSLHF